MNVLCDSSTAVRRHDGREQRQNFQFPHWQFLSDVAWESLKASCWRLHHCCSNWCRCSGYLPTWPKPTDQISFLAKRQYGCPVLKFIWKAGFMCSVNQSGPEVLQPTKSTQHDSNLSDRFPIMRRVWKRENEKITLRESFINKHTVILDTAFAQSAE